MDVPYSQIESGATLKDRPRMGRKVTRKTPHKQVGNRLKAARLALGYEVLEEYAREAKIRSNYYSGFEVGARLITLENAQLLKRRFNLSLDFIYDGDLDQVSLQLARKITENLSTMKG